MITSVIIPTYNEEPNIGSLIDYLNSFKGGSEIEVIVCDGNSSDNTRLIAENKNAIVITSQEKGRAFQMNCGAAKAKGDILYFVHADTLPPKYYTNCIKEAVLNGYTSGCCAYKFDSNKWPLKINSYLTRFNGPLSGGGDQTLFVTKSVFKKIGGFNTKYSIMEDFDLTRRLKKNCNFKIIKNRALVSARKYEKNSYLKVNVANIIAMLLFWANIDPQHIHNFYKKTIKS